MFSKLFALAVLAAFAPAASAEAPAAERTRD
jgi:hypothetical protein